MENDIKKAVILLVDDSPENITMLIGILGSLYKIQAATNGEESLKIIFSETPPDLILLDIVMPGMDGFEVCSKVKENKQSSEIPVIFLTGEADNEKIVKGFQIGGQDYVTKPFNSQELLSRIKTHLELRENREQLKSINLLLEEKVDKRTQQLKEANAKLQELNLQLEKANAQLTNLDQAKSKFLQIISHEIRTPLNGIVGFTELLKVPLESTEYEEYLELLQESVTRLEDFSQKALFITNLQTEKIKPQKTPNRVIALVESVGQKLETVFKNKKIQRKLEIPGDLIINCDIDLMPTCFHQVLENAVKYSPENEVITVKSNKINDMVFIDFIDRGKGFNKEALDNLFKFFSYGEEPVDRNFGFGLAIVKLIMDAHNGKIEVKNETAGGARVRLMFK